MYFENLGLSFFFFFKFSLFPSGVTRANQLSPSNPILYILCLHAGKLHVVFHYINKSPPCSSSWGPACQFHRQPPSINTFTAPPLHISQPSQSGLSDVICKASNMCCVPDAVIPDLMHPDHSHREPQHLHLWESTRRCSLVGSWPLPWTST